MSIFRVEKNTNYTVISNYHLRDRNLSLKTIGLLSVILSLPDNWDYSQTGLAAICKDGEDSIRSGLKELEKYGYLERERERDENGRMKGIIYKVYEVPKNQREVQNHNQQHFTKKPKRDSNPQVQTPALESPRLEKPILVNPPLGNPMLESPKAAAPMSGDCQQLIKDKQNIDIQNIDSQINQSINRTNTMEQGSDMVDRMVGDDKYNAMMQYIHENINYDFFQFKSSQIEEKFENKKITVDEYEAQTSTYDIKKLDQVINYMLDVLSSINNDPIKIGNEIISREVVKSKLMKIKMLDIQKVVAELNTNPSIKNPKKYAISMLYNS